MPASGPLGLCTPTGTDLTLSVYSILMTPGLLADDCIIFSAFSIFTIYRKFCFRKCLVFPEPLLGITFENRVSVSAGTVDAGSLTA